MKEPFRIRNFESADEPACYEICLKTGDNGADGTPLYTDPRVLGHIFVGPYLRYDPELALVLEDEEGVCGYCIGTLDTAKFYDRFLKEWLPELRPTHPKPVGDESTWTEDEKLCHYIHQPNAYYPLEFKPWPSHLHIDLLRRAQGRGFGKRMMRILESRLEDLSSTGIHLGVSSVNDNALAFYRSLGYQPMPDAAPLPEDVVYLGKLLL